MADLDGVTILLTGVGQGLGRGLATSLAAYGARIAAVDIDLAAAVATAEAVDLAGGVAIAHQIDVTSESSVAEAVAWAEVELGPIDLLVNNAGVLSVNNVVDMPVDEWRRVLDVNATGAFLMARQVSRVMIGRAAPGSIVNIASIAGKQGDPGLAHYSASKFAVIGLTQSLARELSGSDITVNAVCPGVVDTPMVAALARGWNTTIEALVAHQAIRRPQRPDEIAAAIVFLHRCRAVTGQSINVDGGTVFS